ncbi:MAG: hypothetical protein ACLPJJ_02215, partial [Acidocella sp.]
MALEIEAASLAHGHEILRQPGPVPTILLSDRPPSPACRFLGLSLERYAAAAVTEGAFQKIRGGQVPILLFCSQEVFPCFSSRLPVGMPGQADSALDSFRAQENKKGTDQPDFEDTIAVGSPPAIAVLREKIRRIEAGNRHAAAVLPFDLPAIDARLPGGG